MRPVRRETLPVLVAEEIKNDIAKGVFRTGKRLPPETKLCEVLGVGRPTLREALRFLEGQGIVQFKYGEGAYVVSRQKAEQLRDSSMKKEIVVELLEQEMVQLEQEGKEIPPDVRDQAKVVLAQGSLEKVNAFYDGLASLNERSGFPYKEPSQLDEILSESHLSDWKQKARGISGLQERLHGAWLGRSVGCMLGKPSEGWSKEQIESYLKKTGSYPLDNYFIFRPEVLGENDQPFHPSADESTRGNIEFAARDDDLDYTILNQRIIKDNGFDFTPEDVGEAWLSYLPFKRVYTAERQAYVNLISAITPPDTATYRNPFREWVGAQIRADIFGYLAPGEPDTAARLAYKDACISHVKNGIYGEMFVAAMIAIAFTESNMEKVIQGAIAYVPRKSRLCEMTNNILSWSRSRDRWQDVWDLVMTNYGKYHWVHVLPNLAFVLIGLLWGQGNFLKTVAISVMCGMDTDCNGATAGSIIGAMKGKEALPVALVDPLHDRLKSAVFGYSDVLLADLSQETMKLVKP